MALDALLPKQKKEEVQLEGILSILAPSNVTIVTMTITKGLKELIYKVCRGYAIEAHRFFHSVNSTHQVFKLMHSEMASSEYAESEEYVGFQSGSEYCCSEGSALIQMAPEETKKFVANLQMDHTEYLAESRIVHGVSQYSEDDEEAD